MRSLNNQYLRSIILVICIALLTAGAIYIDKKTYNRDCQPLVVVTSSDSAPFSFYQNNQLIGFDIDLISLISKELGRTVTFDDVPFYLLFKRLGPFYPKKADLAITAITSTPTRNITMDLTIPYHTSSSVLLITKNSDIHAEKDLKEKTIGVRKGSIQENLAKTDWLPIYRNIQLRTFNTITKKELSDLKEGKIHALALDNEEAQSYLKKYQEFDSIRLKGTENNLSIALPKGSCWTPKINQIIKRFNQDGTIKKLEEKWLSGAYTICLRSPNFTE